jgi:pimeloyl-ACP methyl ester carboxylesterase
VDLYWDREREDLVLPTVIFVHGAFIWEPEWWWRPVAERLASHGIESRTVQLPSCGPEPPLGDLHDDAAAVRGVIDSIEGPVILVGHSYGGIVISEAAAGQPSVRHLVYMSAFVPDGTSAVTSEFTNPNDMRSFDLTFGGDGLRARLGSLMVALTRGRVSSWMVPFASRKGIVARLTAAMICWLSAGGYATGGEGGTKAYLLEELPEPALVEGSLRRLTRQAAEAGVQAPRAAAWKEIPSTFIVILHDLDVSVERQRTHAGRCTHVIEMPTNHFAHLERPDLVCDALVEVAARVTGGERTTAG